MYIAEKEIEIRYSETDQMGIVYHANYIIWLELGRSQLIKELGYDYVALEAEGVVAPVLDISIQYKAAMRYGQVATVRTWVESHGRLRTTYGYEILHEDGTVAVTATSQHTLVKKDNFRPVSLAKLNAQWDLKYKEIAKQQN